MIPSRNEFFNIPLFFKYLDELEYKNTLFISKKDFKYYSKFKINKNEEININLTNKKHQFSESIIRYDFLVERSSKLRIYISSSFFGDVFLNLNFKILGDKIFNLEIFFDHRMNSNIFFYLNSDLYDNVKFNKNIYIKVSDFPNINFKISDYIGQNNSISENNLFVCLDKGSGRIKLNPRSIVIDNGFYKCKTLYYYMDITNIILDFYPELLKISEKGKTELCFNNAEQMEESFEEIFRIFRRK